MLSNKHTFFMNMYHNEYLNWISPETFEFESTILLPSYYNYNFINLEMTSFIAYLANIKSLYFYSELSGYMINIYHPYLVDGFEFALLHNARKQYHYLPYFKDCSITSINNNFIDLYLSFNTNFDLVFFLIQIINMYIIVFFKKIPLYLILILLEILMLIIIVSFLLLDLTNPVTISIAIILLALAACETALGLTLLIKKIENK